MTLNLDKCEFGKREVKLVGHIVGSGSRRADPQRTECMRNMLQPRTKHELRKFLRAMGYYNLTDLTSKRTGTPNVLQWDEEQENAF